MACAGSTKPVDLRLVYTVPVGTSGFTVGFRDFHPVPINVAS
jgi:hypothetical protein